MLSMPRTDAPAKSPSPSDALDSTLAALVADGFSEPTFIKLVRAKWRDNFAEYSAPVPVGHAADSGFEPPRLLGVVKNFPLSVERANVLLALPIVRVQLQPGRVLSERSSRRRQFVCAKKILEHFDSRGIPGADGTVSAGLFVFSDVAGTFRLSLVSVNFDAQGKRRWSAARRQSFFVSAGTPSRTFTSRLRAPAETLEDLRDVFSVEALTREFYIKIEKWFERACSRVRFPGVGLLGKGDTQEEHNKTMVLRLITRLIFIWFLKEKGLVPAEFFNEKGARELLNFTAENADKSICYRAILQNLFFAVLDTPREQRGWIGRQTGRQEYFRYARFFKNGKKSEKFTALCNRVPFVNGGLFENLDLRDGIDEKTKAPIHRIDCFSNRTDSETLLCVPDTLFFGEQFRAAVPAAGAAVPESDDGQGIFQILSEFNFTVEENAPEDADVSLDPELLGRVFENLLASVVPETKEQARKSTGSFYTPREIVNYMVCESLIAYLTKKFPAVPADALRRLVENDDFSLADEPAIARAAEQIDDSLRSAKILDPACGSGAFPMGILTRIIAVLERLERLDPDDSAAVCKAKLDIIRDCIYGVDIQDIAVQISKLRCFISLLCEQKVDPQKENFGISPLPNLYSNFVTANSLIALPQIEHKNQDELALGNTGTLRALQSELRIARRDYFSATKKDEKRRLRSDDKKLRERIRQEISGGDSDTQKPAAKLAGLIAGWDPYRVGDSAEFFDPEWMLGVPAGFDIVIGNPPYISAPAQVKSPELKKQREVLAHSGCYEMLCSRWDLYVAFIERGLKLLAPAGTLTYIIPFPFTNQGYGKVARKKLLKEWNLFGLADLNGTKIFESATVSNCIPFISREEPSGTCVISKISGEKGLWKIAPAFTRSHTDLVQDEKTQVWNLSQQTRDANRHEDMNTLGDFCFISYGLRPNSDERTAKGEFKKADLISKTMDDVHCRKYIEAKDISRYSINRVRYLEYGTERSPDKLVRPTFREFYNHPKLFFNVLGDLTGTMDDTNNYVHNHSLIGCILWHDLHGVENKSIMSSIKKFSRLSRQKMEKLSHTVSLEYLLGVMNSRYASYLLSTHRGDDYHIYPEHIRKIPVPAASAAQQKPIIALVEKILAAKRGNAGADTSAREREIDALVYKLYGLTDEEIAHVEASAGAVPAAETEETPAGTAKKPQAPPKTRSRRGNTHARGEFASDYDPRIDD